MPQGWCGRSFPLTFQLGCVIVGSGIWPWLCVPCCGGRWWFPVIPVALCAPSKSHAKAVVFETLPEVSFLKSEDRISKINWQRAQRAVITAGNRKHLCQMHIFPSILLPLLFSYWSPALCQPLAVLVVLHCFPPHWASLPPITVSFTVLGLLNATGGSHLQLKPAHGGAWHLHCTEWWNLSAHLNFGPSLVPHFFSLFCPSALSPCIVFTFISHQHSPMSALSIPTCSFLCPVGHFVSSCWRWLTACSLSIWRTGVSSFLPLFCIFTWYVLFLRRLYAYLGLNTSPIAAVYSCFLS